MTYTRYLKRMLITALILLSTVVAFNIAVDPYGIFDQPRRPGFNALKPYAGDRGRIAKIHQVIATAPRGLIIGNSRTEMGLNPENACWPGDHRPVYNLSIPGLSQYLQTRYAQHGLATGSVRVLVAAVDFIDFLIPAGSSGDPHRWPPANETDPPLLVDADGNPRTAFTRERLVDMLKASLSLDALSHSVSTVLQQNGRHVKTRTRLGFNPAEAIYEPIINREGARVLFIQKNRELMRRLLARRWSLYYRGSRWSENFEALRRLLRAAAAKGVSVTLFINPYHAEYMSALDIAGLWPLFEEWKRRIAEIATEEGDVPLYDFSAFNAFTTENIDDVAPRGQALKWFWEPAHYRRELGDRIITALTNGTCRGPRVPPPLPGVRLTVKNIAAHLQDLRKGRDDYRQSHPAVIARLRSLAGKVRKNQ